MRIIDHVISGHSAGDGGRTRDVRDTPRQGDAADHAAGGHEAGDHVAPSPASRAVPVPNAL